MICEVLSNADAAARMAQERRDEFDRRIAARHWEEQLSEFARPTWESMSAAQQAALANDALGHSPFLMRLFRNRGWQSRLVRDELVPRLLGSADLSQSEAAQ